MTPRQYPDLRRMRRPASDQELAEVSKAYFGTPVSMRRLEVNKDGWGSYEVEQDFEVYAISGQYDAPSRFFAWAVGSLNCGGVARTNYGQFLVHGHRNKKRLKRWCRSRQR